MTTAPTTGFLTSVIISALAPVFFGVAGGDVTLACIAAAEVIDAHRARNRVDLIAVGQIIANGLAALGSLGQSMSHEVPLPMALRLRNNAISLNRMVEHNRRVRKQNQDADPVDLGADTYVEPAPVEESVAEDPPQHFATEAVSPTESATAEPPTPEERQQRRTQAIAMIREAGDISENLRNLPPSEREHAEFRVAMLGRSVRELITGEQLPPLVQSSNGTAMNGPAGH